MGLDLLIKWDAVYFSYMSTAYDAILFSGPASHLVYFSVPSRKIETHIGLLEELAALLRSRGSQCEIHDIMDPYGPDGPNEGPLTYFQTTVAELAPLLSERTKLLFDKDRRVRLIAKGNL